MTRASLFLRLLPDTPAADLQGPGVPLEIASASMVKDFDLCERRGYLKHRNGLATDSTGAADTGTMLHGQWEAYSRHGTTPTDARAIGALSLLPPPGARGVVVERAFSFPSPVARLVRWGNGPQTITWAGHWDLYDGRDPKNHVVTDHKTTSDFKYSKAPHELQTDPQMVLYAQATAPEHATTVQVCPDCAGTGRHTERDGLTTHPTCEGCGSTGRLAPLVEAGIVPRAPGSHVTVRHLVTLTKAIKTGRPAREVPFTFSPETLAAEYARLNDNLEHVVRVWAKNHWTETAPAYSACGAFGGCPFARYCDDHQGDSEGTAALVLRLLSFMDWTRAAETPATTEKEATMTAAAPPPPPAPHHAAAALAGYQAPPPPRATGVIPPDGTPAVARLPGQAEQVTLEGAIAARLAAPPPPPAAPPPPPTAAPSGPVETTVQVWGSPHAAWVLQEGKDLWVAWTPDQQSQGRGTTEQQARTRLTAALCARIPPPATPPPPPAVPKAPEPPAPPAPPAKPWPWEALKEKCGGVVQGMEFSGVGGWHGVRKDDGMAEGWLLQASGEMLVRTATTPAGLLEVFKAYLSPVPLAPLPPETPAPPSVPAEAAPPTERRRGRPPKEKPAAAPPPPPVAAAPVQAPPPPAAPTTSARPPEVLTVEGSEVRVWPDGQHGWVAETGLIPGVQYRSPGHATREDALASVTQHIQKAKVAPETSAPPAPVAAAPVPEKVTGLVLNGSPAIHRVAEAAVEYELARVALRKAERRLEAARAVLHAQLDPEG